MIIPDEIRKSVCFISTQEISGEEVFRGTAFMVSRTNAVETPFGNLGYAYVVTAKHVIDKIKDLGCQFVYLRLNFADGSAKSVATEANRWAFHPKDSVKEPIDVAVLPLLRTELGNVDHLTYPLSAAATDEKIDQFQIGIGEDLFLVGLFTRRLGEKRNIPIVRIGNIAAMREELVETKYGKMDAYLIESRSLGGLSGSPVFVHLGTHRRVGAGVVHAAAEVFFLLGLMHGHWDIDNDKVDVEPDTTGIAQLNMGIAMVVPVQKVIETIEQPVLKQLEDAMNKAIREKWFPTAD